MSEEKMATGLESNMTWLNKKLKADQNFDVVYRVIHVGGKNACIYFIDGFCKDELMQKLLQQFMGITAEDMPKDAHEMAKSFVPYVEVDLKDSWEEILYSLMSGVFALFVDGFDKCILIDSRTYPSRGVEEPEKDKVLRGSKDGFVETIVFNTALIRRRIRSTELVMEMMHAGKSSKTDIVLCYMDNRVDHAFLEKIRDRIIKTAAVFGKQPFRFQAQDVKQRTHVVAGTPGRVLDHLEQGTLRTEKIRYIIIDEADEMLNMGFIETVQKIFFRLPKNASVCMFSATLPQEIQELAHDFLKQAEVVEIESQTSVSVISYGGL